MENPATRNSHVLKSDHFYYQVILFVFLLGVFLRFHYMTGPIGSDDTRYLKYASMLVSLQPFDEQAAGGGVRLLFLFLIGIPYKLFGHSVYAAIFNILYSALADLLVIWFCGKTIGRQGALISAIVMAFSPLNILYPGMILPDTVAALFMVLAVILVHRAIQHPEKNKRYLRIGVGGLVACLAYMAKDPGILLLPAVGLVLFFWPAERSWKERFLAPLMFVLGLLVMACGDGLLYFAYTGDFLFKVHATASYHNSQFAAVSATDFINWAFDNFKRELYKGDWAMVPFNIGIPVMLLAILFVPGVRLFAVAGLITVVFLIFGSSSLTRLVPLPFQERYFQPVVPFAAVSLAYLINRFSFSRKAWMEFVLPFLLACLVFLSGLGFVTRLAGASYDATAFKAMRQAIEMVQDEKQDIYVDPYSHFNLIHFLSPSAYSRLKVFSNEGELLPGLYLVFSPFWMFTQEEISATTGINLERLREIRNLRVRFQSLLDERKANEFRESDRPELVLGLVGIYEKETNASLIPLPDLIPDKGDCQETEIGQIICTLLIRNLSPYGSSKTTFTFGNDIEPSIAIQSNEISPIPGFSTLSLTVGPLEVPKGETNYRFWIDPQGAIQERNRINNILVIRIL